MTSRGTPQFWKLYDALPADIKAAAFDPRDRPSRDTGVNIQVLHDFEARH